MSSAAHQTCQCIIANFSYRTISCPYFGFNHCKIVFICTSQTTWIWYINFVRSSTIFDHPYTTRFCDSQDRHQTLSYHIWTDKRKDLIKIDFIFDLIFFLIKNKKKKEKLTFVLIVDREFLRSLPS